MPYRHILLGSFIIFALTAVGLADQAMDSKKWVPFPTSEATPWGESAPARSVGAVLSVAEDLGAQRRKLVLDSVPSGQGTFEVVIDRDDEVVDLQFRHKDGRSSTFYQVTPELSRKFRSLWAKESLKKVSYTIHERKLSDVAQVTPHPNGTYTISVGSRHPVDIEFSAVGKAKSYTLHLRKSDPDLVKLDEIDDYYPETSSFSNLSADANEALSELFRNHVPRKALSAGSASVIRKPADEDTSELATH